MTPQSKNSKKAAKGARKPTLIAAAARLMEAWAEWRNTTDQMPSDAVLNAVGDIFDACGQTFDDQPDGVYRVWPVIRPTPKPKRRAAKPQTKKGTV